MVKIDSYRFGTFVIDNKEYKHNIRIIKDRVSKHRYLPNHELKLDDFTEIINSSPTHVVIGTGAYGVMKVPNEIVEYIERRNIHLIIQKTSQACKTFNELVKEGKKAAAFLHDTC